MNLGITLGWTNSILKNAASSRRPLPVLAAVLTLACMLHTPAASATGPLQKTDTTRASPQHRVPSHRAGPASADPGPGAAAGTGASAPDPAPDKAAPQSRFEDRFKLLLWRDVDGREHAIGAPADWDRRRRGIVDAMRAVMGDPPAPVPTSPPAVRVLEEQAGDAVIRRKIEFEAEPGDWVPAYLLVPETAGRRRPAMLCLHQTTPAGKAEPSGLAGLTNLHYALELARRGYVALAPDYPNFGDYRMDAYSRGYASATMKGIVNHRRAVDLLAAWEGVDPNRMGVIGHSLGGHNALFVAAFDARIRAVVTSCGFNSFFKYMGGDLKGWSHAGYMPRIAAHYGADPRRMPFDFTEVIAAIAPRPVFVNAPVHDANFEISGVKDCLVAANPVYRLLGAEGRLRAVHPECGHDFPRAVRIEAYAWLDAWLNPGE